jgi:hypothetical protein
MTATRIRIDLPTTIAARPCRSTETRAQRAERFEREAMPSMAKMYPAALCLTSRQCG